MSGFWPGRSSQPGIESLHRFSAGPYYDPANVAAGPVIGCDLHTVEPGAGFDWHAHRGVVIVSRVLSGVLRHEDSGGAVLHVAPGPLLVQGTGDGVRHTETNGSDTEPLRFLQVTLLLDAPGRVELCEPPVQLPGGVEVRTAEPGVTAAEHELVVGPDDGALVVGYGRWRDGPMVEG